MSIYTKYYNVVADALWLYGNSRTVTLLLTAIGYGCALVSAMILNGFAHGRHENGVALLVCLVIAFAAGAQVAKRLIAESHVHAMRCQAVDDITAERSDGLLPL